MDFDTLLANIEAGKIDDVKTALTEFKPQFEKTVSDLKSFESKFNDAVQTRDKAKQRLNEVAGVFGVGSDELTTDKLKEMIKTAKSDDASKAEIDNLTKLLQQKEGEFTQQLTDYESKFRDKMIEVEIAKLGANIDVVNDKALSLVIDSLKDGATLDNGTIVYKDASGATVRNASGQPMTIAERMAQFKSDANNSFLFKPTSTSGGGSTTSTGTSTSGNISLDGDKASRMEAISRKYKL